MRAFAALGEGKKTILADVAEAAQPFVVACLARAVREQRVWVVCPDVRRQEEFASELAAWLPAARLLPEWEAFAEEVLRDPETVAERLEILGLLARDRPIGPLVVHSAQWDQNVPAASALTGSLFSLAKGDTLILTDAAEVLANSAYERVSQVATRGQFSIRGGIMDVFSWQAALPVRIELDDLTVASIRNFDPDSQVSIKEADSCEIFAGKLEAQQTPLRNYLRNRDLLIDLASSEQRSDFRISAEGGDHGISLFPQPFGEFEIGRAHV